MILREAESSFLPTAMARVTNSSSWTCTQIERLHVVMLGLVVVLVVLVLVLVVVVKDQKKVNNVIVLIE